MVKNKRQTRSSGKKNNKNNSPSRAHKRKQRRRNNETKASTYSTDNTPESIATALSTATGVGRTRRQKKLFAAKTNGSKSTNDDDAKTTPTKPNSNLPTKHNDNNNNTPLHPKNLFETNKKITPPLTTTPPNNQSDRTNIIINGQLDITYNDADTPIADDTNPTHAADVIDGMSTDGHNTGNAADDAIEIDTEDESQNSTDDDPTSKKPKLSLLVFLHRACFSPPLSTWTQAIDKNYFTTWPGPTAAAVRKYLPKSLAAAKGHLKASPKNLCASTSQPSPAPPLPSPSPVLPTSLSSPDVAARTHIVYAKVVAITGQIDQTGRFPVTSSRGHKYVMVVYDYDSTAILAEPIKNRSERKLLRAYSFLHTHLTNRGLKPQLQKLDNECLQALKQFMRQHHVDFQLDPPYDHRQNDRDLEGPLHRGPCKPRSCVPHAFCGVG
jgi:hypothetical protein